ncbi:MAG: chloride channel protein [Nitrososphaeria archaeon]
MLTKIRWLEINIWIAPIIMGVLIGLAVSIAFYIFYGLWKIFEKALLIVPKLSFSFIFLSIILSSLPLRMFLKRRPKDSFDIILEYYHTSPESFSFKESLIYSLSSFLSFAFGAPVGPEGGAAMIGAGIAKKIKETFKVNIESNTVLLTGLAAGFTALFKAPISGFLLALELPYKGDLEKDPFLPSALASATAYLTSFVLKTPSLILVQNIQMPGISTSMIAISLGFGVLSGVFSVVFISVYKAFTYVAQNLMKLASFPMLILIGGLLVGFLGYRIQPSIGPGFLLLNYTIYMKLSIFSAIIILVSRLISVSSVINFGASGGLLLPSIEIGALFGYITGYLLYPKYLIVFVLLGMATMAAGVNKLVLVPVTFLLELVGGSIAIPILIASITSYFISYKFTIYEYQPANKLDKGTFALERFYIKALKTAPQTLEINISEIMNKQAVYIDYTKTVSEAFDLLKQKMIKILPVVNEEKIFLGYISIEYLASLPDRYKSLPLAELEIKKGLTVSENSTLKDSIELMLNSGEDHVFVVNKKWELVGVITEVDIIRYLLKAIS